jgi:hypothetical protein
LIFKVGIPIALVLLISSKLSTVVTIAPSGHVPWPMTSSNEPAEEPLVLNY